MYHTVAYAVQLHINIVSMIDMQGSCLNGNYVHHNYDQGELHSLNVLAMQSCTYVLSTCMYVCTYIDWSFLASYRAS